MLTDSLQQGKHLDLVNISISPRPLLRSPRSNEKDEVCHSFLVEMFTKYLPTGDVKCVIHLVVMNQLTFLFFKPTSNYHDWQWDTLYID